MKSLRLSLTLAVFLAVGGSIGSAFAEEAPLRPNIASPEQQITPSTAATAVSRFGAALQLVDLGRTTSDPFLLVAAAQAITLLGSSPGNGTIGKATEIPADVTKPRSRENHAGSDKPESDDDLVAGLLTQARRMARGNELVLTLANEVEAAGAKGNLRGPRTYRIKVDPQQAINVQADFKGLEPAEIQIAGDGDTDVDLVVYDENDIEICRSMGERDQESCRWFPAWTGRFTIRLINLGAVWNGVQLVTN